MNNTITEIIVSVISNNYYVYVSENVISGMSVLVSSL